MSVKVQKLYDVFWGLFSFVWKSMSRILRILYKRCKMITLSPQIIRYTFIKISFLFISFKYYNCSPDLNSWFFGKFQLLLNFKNIKKIRKTLSSLQNSTASNGHSTTIKGSNYSTTTFAYPPAKFMHRIFVNHVWPHWNWI